MSSDNKENTENDKKKKTRPRLSIKIFSGSSKKKENLRKIHEEHHDVAGSLKAQQSPEVTSDEKSTSETKKETSEKHQEMSDSDTSDEAVPLPPSRPGRRSLSACADVQETRIKRRDAQKEEEDETDNGDQLSPLPSSPTRSCMRMRERAATFSEGENVEVRARQRSVSFSPETVDPPPRNVKYREWIEARTKRPPVNVKHEKHKQKMSQLKKVNLSDYLSSPSKRGATGVMSATTSAFGGGGGLMM